MKEIDYVFRLRLLYYFDRDPQGCLMLFLPCCNNAVRNFGFQILFFRQHLMPWIVVKEFNLQGIGCIPETWIEHQLKSMFGKLLGCGSRRIDFDRTQIDPGAQHFGAIREDAPDKVIMADNIPGMIRSVHDRVHSEKAGFLD